MYDAMNKGIALATVLRKPFRKLGQLRVACGGD
jgi:hypothetical protein